MFINPLRPAHLDFVDPSFISELLRGYRYAKRNRDFWHSLVQIQSLHEMLNSHCPFAFQKGSMVSLSKQDQCHSEVGVA